LRSWALAQRDMIDRHPWVTEMPMATPPMAPNSLTFVERGLEALDGADLPDADKLRIIGLISSYTLSEARMAHDATRAAEAGDAAAATGFEVLLRQLVDDANYPRLHRIAWASGVGDKASGPDGHEEFAFGLERILDGVAALIAKPARRRR
jgi:hypothetical protein